MKANHSLLRAPALVAAFLSLAAALPAAEPVHIVCIGDSITQGRGGHASSGKKVIPTNGWRWAFWKKTVDAEIPVKFVGSKTEGFGSTPSYPRYRGKQFDNRHEARWGWTTEGIRKALKESGAAWTADAALIYLGTNQEKLGLWQKLTDPHGVRRTACAMKGLVKDLRARNPHMLIALRLPQGEGPRERGLEREFRKIAAEFNLPGSPATAVSAPADWQWDPKKPDSDTVDGCHPNKRGDEKIAQGFFDAIRPLLTEAH
jgi:lysophospholipase L1-like esterase